MWEMKYSFHDCIWIFHKWSLPWDPQISSYGFNGQFMIPYWSVHGTIYAFWIMSKVSPVPVHCDSCFWKINCCVMILCCWYSIGSYYWNRNVVINNCMSLVSEECLIVLFGEWSIFWSSCPSIWSWFIMLNMSRIWCDKCCILCRSLLNFDIFWFKLSLQFIPYDPISSCSG